MVDRDGMSTAQEVQDRSEVRDTTAALELAIPVFNEERDLETSVRRLRRYLDGCFPVSTLVTIADNASTDATWSIAERREASSRSCAKIPSRSAADAGAAGGGADGRLSGL